MLVLVPAPPWRRSTTISAASAPAASSRQARSMASALASSPAHAPSVRLVRAQASLTVPKARASSPCTGSPASGKFSSARSVWAPCRPAAGTATSPSRSRSMRVSSLMLSASAAGLSPSVGEDHLLDVHALYRVQLGHHGRGLVVGAEELDEHEAARRAHVGVHVVQPHAC